MTHPAHENIIAGFTFPGKYAAIKTKKSETASDS